MHLSCQCPYTNFLKARKIPEISSISKLRTITPVQKSSCAYAANNQPTQGINESEIMHQIVASSISYSKRAGVKGVKAPVNAVDDFFFKVRLAWNIFFPPPVKTETSKEEVKKRLRMVLVADRCGMSPASLTEMKKTIVTALQEFVDIEAEDAIEVSISNDVQLGTVYSVNIPVRRVKPDSRFGSNLPEGQLAEGITLEWDPENWDSDPSSRFPMGC
ncbi:hypothetical protein CEUSTIGMA_g7291.t1 [Chlamydomonas eustigma]|uniref:Cell division topological specificity factor MinE n=1 Tax=Chlamydomonas eustigma TaxID=1157962 RepID=A0A250X9T2_9CHLO|nr:hypothetical protein CEUSTIGMA_g7291.t1 [Chlamydomonas eustigma]|eukprot:GAX79851.1 hypothetical protein CEUSTIGMA_g7291.t1 [Chlamydomonas eustigma]